MTDKARVTHESIVGGYEGRMLFTLSLATLCSMGARFLLPPLLPAIIDDLAISSTVAGLALSIMWGCTAISHYPSGRLSDELTRKTLLVPSIALMILGLGTLVTIPTLAMFFVGITALGIGAGFYTPVAFAQLSDLYVHRRGLAFGINSASLNLGGLLGSLLAIGSLQYLGWRLAFAPIIVLLLLVLALLHHYSSESYVLSQPPLNVHSSVGRLLSTRKLRCSLAVATVFGFAWQAILSFLPTFLHVEKGLSTTVGSVAFGGVFLVGIVMTPLAGRLGDRWTYLRIVVLSTVVTTLGLSIVLLGSSLTAIGTGVFVLALGLTAFWPAMNAQVMELLPNQSLGGDYGAVRTIFIAAESLGPVFVAYIGDHLDYETGFLAILTILVFSSLAALYLSVILNDDLARAIGFPR